VEGVKSVEVQYAAKFWWTDTSLPMLLTVRMQMKQNWPIICIAWSDCEYLIRDWLKFCTKPASRDPLGGLGRLAANVPDCTVVHAFSLHSVRSMLDCEQSTPGNYYNHMYVH